ncbi:MAG: serine/threonine-protein kinase, partial [Polyangiaceae bacterium]
HPNVVTVFDVGTVDEQLFVAMEFVSGDLAAWLEDEARAWRKVVQIFVEAGRGLAAAHAVELVHRDFKPANVLIDPDERPRVTDFGLVAALAEEGVAVVTDASARDASDAALDLTVSAGRRILGTPAYMAPEQFERTSVDDKADQFAFCVALYEGLYRARPFGGRTVDELAENVIEGRMAPPPESDTPSWLWPVIEQGLSPRPSHRHASMATLLDALEHDPEASQRRLVVLDAMIDFGRARASAGDAQAAREILDDALVEAGGLGDRTRMAKTHVALALIDTAQASYDMAQQRLEWSRALLEDADGEAATEARMLHVEGFVHYRQSRFDEAEVSLRRAVDKHRECFGEGAVEMAEVRTSLGETLRARGDAAQACEELERAHAEALEARGSMSREAAMILDTLAGTLQDLGRYDEAIARYQEALAMRQKLLGEEHPLTADSYVHLGQILLMMSRYDEATATLEKGLAISERVLGPTNQSTRAALNNLGGVYLKRGDAQRSWEALHRSLAIAEHLYGPRHPEVATTLNNIANLHHETGQLDEALALFERALDIRREVLGPDHPLVAASLGNVAGNLLERGQVDEALVQFERVLEATKRTRGPDHPDTAFTHINLASALMFAGRDDEAEEHLQAAERILKAVHGDRHEALVLVWSNLGDITFRRDDKVGAIEHYQRAVELNEALGRSAHVVMHAIRNLSHCLILEERHAEAIPSLEMAVTFMSERPASLLLAILRGQLAAALWDGGGDRDRAETLVRASRQMLSSFGEQGAEMIPFVDQWMAERDLKP